jgi:hypothetical protein
MTRDFYPPGTLVRITDAAAIGLPEEFQGAEVVIWPDVLPGTYAFRKEFGRSRGPWYITPDEFEVLRLPGAEEATDA